MWTWTSILLHTQNTTETKSSETNGYLNTWGHKVTCKNEKSISLNWCPERRLHERNLIPKWCSPYGKKIPAEVFDGQPKFFIAFGQRFRFTVDVVAVLFIRCDSVVGRATHCMYVKVEKRRRFGEISFSLENHQGTNAFSSSPCM